MDFTVRGQSQLIQSLCETVPFLGARLAGLHRLGRGAVENPRAFAAKGMTIALASMALYALNQALNPDDWDKMEDWEKTPISISGWTASISACPSPLKSGSFSEPSLSG